MDYLVLQITNFSSPGLKENKRCFSLTVHEVSSLSIKYMHARYMKGNGQNTFTWLNFVKQKKSSMY